MTHELPTEVQLDALREVANIGCGNAATALSKMVGGRTVRIDVPRVLAARPEEILLLVGERSHVWAAVLEIEGSLKGRMLLVWPEADARELASLLVGHETDPVRDASSQNALAELANIVGSACLNAIGSLTGFRLVPSPPSISAGTGRDVVSQLLPADGGSRAAVVLEARFQAAHVPPLSGRLFVVPDRGSLPRLFGALGL
jgi:chemotaxis protein CheC